MLELRNPRGAHSLLASVSIGSGGLAPIFVIAAAFGVIGAKVGVPFAPAALLGGIGGTASLIIHELGHVRAARRAGGISSAAISLIWLGAVTRFEGEYEDGGEQTRVAIGGPLASFIVAVSLIAACALPMPMQVRAGVFLLVLFNLAIGVVNLVPAYPLDGHKLVVGLLWLATGSERKARRLLRRVGIGCAALELPSAAFLITQRPQLGIAAAVLAASVLVQKHFARQAAPRAGS